MKIAVENWEMYNNGELMCKWFDTEIDSIDYVYEWCADYATENGYSDDLELFVADYEGDDLGAYRGSDSVEYAYEISEKIEALDDDEVTAVMLLLENGVVSDLDEAIEERNEIINTGETDMEEVAYNYANECMEIPKHLEFYIDYEKMGRDMEIEGNYYKDKEGYIWECVA